MYRVFLKIKNFRYGKELLKEITKAMENLECSKRHDTNEGNTSLLACIDVGEARIVCHGVIEL